MSDAIPRERVEVWLPAGWIALSPSEGEQVARLLRNYSAEVFVEHGVPAIAADALADRLEKRGPEQSLEDTHG